VAQVVGHLPSKMRPWVQTLVQKKEKERENFLLFSLYICSIYIVQSTNMKKLIKCCFTNQEILYRNTLSMSFFFYGKVKWQPLKGGALNDESDDRNGCGQTHTRPLLVMEDSLSVHERN
jgi:hypothetical protein